MAFISQKGPTGFFSFIQVSHLGLVPKQIIHVDSKLGLRFSSNVEHSGTLELEHDWYDIDYD